MSTTDSIRAVLHLDNRDYEAINKLAYIILTKGIYFNIALFITPSIAELDFRNQYNASCNAVAAADNGGSKSARKVESRKMHKMLKKLMNYTNDLYEDDAVSLLKSGFELNLQPSPHPRPNQLIIKKIVAGADMGTVKIYLQPLSGLEIHLKEKRTYIVYVFADSETLEFRIGHTGTDSREIIIENVPLMTRQYYAITATNAAGESMLSNRVKFTLTD